MAQAFTEKQKQEWIERIHQQQESGLSIASWCRENNIAPDSFYYWKSRLYPQIKPISFTELKNSTELGIYLEFHGIKLHVSSKHYDSKLLKSLLRDLMEIKC